MFTRSSAEQSAVPLRARLRYGIALGLASGVGVSSSQFILGDWRIILSIALIVVLYLIVGALHLLSIKKSRPVAWAGYGLWLFSGVGLAYYCVYISHLYVPCGILDLPRRLAGCQQSTSFERGPIAAEYALDGSFVLLFTSRDGELQQWFPVSNRLVPIASGGPPTRLQRQLTTISSDSTTIGVARGSTVELWASVDQKRVATLTLAVADITSLQFMPNAMDLLVTSGTTQTLLLDATTSKVRQPIFSQHPVTAGAIAPDGAVIALFGKSSEVELFSARDGRALATLRHQSTAISASFTPDGGALISADGAGHLYRWDARDFRLSYVIQAFAEDEAQVVVISPDSTVIATGDDYDTRRTAVQLWRASDGAPIRRLPQSYAWSLSFAPAGDLLVAGGHREVYLWRVSAAEGQ